MELDNDVVRFDPLEEAEFRREIDVPALEALRRFMEAANQLVRLLCGEEGDQL